MANASGRFFGWVMGVVAARGPGRRLARLRLGPERRHARRHPGRGRRSRRSRRPGCCSCSACPRAPPSGSRPAPRWRTSPAWPRRGTRCSAAPAGTSRRDGLAGAPRVRVLVGAEGHGSVVLALRYLGLGAAGAGRRRRRRAGWTPTTCARGSRADRARRSSACRPATSTPARSTRCAAAVEVAHRAGAWVHVDGAFGLWAARRPGAGAADRRAWPPPTPGRPTRTRR